MKSVFFLFIQLLYPGKLKIPSGKMNFFTRQAVLSRYPGN